MRVGDVALDAANLQHAAHRAAPADADHVAEGLVTGRLANDAPVDGFIASAQGIHDFQGPVAGTTFLVTGDQERDASIVFRMRCDKSFRCDDHCRQTAFHVRAAASVDQAIPDPGFERIRLPLVEAAGRHHVGMPGKTEYRRRRAAACPQVRDIREWHRLADKPRGLQARAEQLLAAGIVGRHGSTTHEFEQQSELGSVGKR